MKIFCEKTSCLYFVIFSSYTRGPRKNRFIPVYFSIILFQKLSHMQLPLDILSSPVVADCYCLRFVESLGPLVPWIPWSLGSTGPLDPLVPWILWSLGSSGPLDSLVLWSLQPIKRVKRCFFVCKGFLNLACFICRLSKSVHIV